MAIIGVNFCYFCYFSKISTEKRVMEPAENMVSDKKAHKVYRSYHRMGQIITPPPFNCVNSIWGILGSQWELIKH